MRASHGLKPRTGAADERLGLPATDSNALFQDLRQSFLLSEKLRVDFWPVGRMCVPMSPSEEDYDLISALCTRAGMLMEDVVAQAITSPPRPQQKLVRYIETLKLAAADCQILLGAAEVLARRS